MADDRYSIVSAVHRSDGNHGPDGYRGTSLARDDSCLAMGCRIHGEHSWLPSDVYRRHRQRSSVAMDWWSIIGYGVLLAVLSSFGMGDVARMIDTLVDGAYGLQGALFGTVKGASGAFANGGHELVERFSVKHLADRHAALDHLLRDRGYDRVVPAPRVSEIATPRARERARRAPRSGQNRLLRVWGRSESHPSAER